ARRRGVSGRRYPPSVTVRAGRDAGADPARGQLGEAGRVELPITLHAARVGSGPAGHVTRRVASRYGAQPAIRSDNGVYGLSMYRHVVRVPPATSTQAGRLTRRTRGGR